MKEGNSIQFEPNAKINLGLFIKRKRPDGYHELDTLFYPVALSDKLEVSKVEASVCTLETKGVAIDAEQEKNLCWKAWNLLRKHHPRIGGAHIKLEKRIPAGSGLGGGSSDAAFTLLALRELYDPEISMHELSLLASQLGADVPFFLYNKPALASGTGTSLLPVNLHLPYEVRIITPNVHSSTPEAYRNLDITGIDMSLSLSEVMKMPIPDWKMYMRNDLEKPVFAMYPELARIKSQLYDEGAVYASMSGSGSALFGLFHLS
jgi:4-diphosphocytidyl-2-C-methyl-D-erythritol kinase